jgi:hypothetical protein
MKRQTAEEKSILEEAGRLQLTAAWQVLGLELRAYTLSHSTSPITGWEPSRNKLSRRGKTPIYQQPKRDQKDKGPKRKKINCSGTAINLLSPRKESKKSKWGCPCPNFRKSPKAPFSPHAQAVEPLRTPKHCARLGRHTSSARKALSSL